LDYLGSAVTIEVEDDNAPALALYTGRGTEPNYLPLRKALN
jgi:hypothetical protein